MKTISLATTLLIFCCSICFSQTTKDGITIKAGFGGIKFYQGEQKLSMQDVKSMMQSNQQAYQQIKSAQSATTIAAIIGGIGGALVGWPIGTAISGKDANWTLAGIGAGLIAVSIPIGLKGIKNAKRAVATYNDGLGSSSFWNRNELRLSMAGNKIGLTLQL